MNAPVESMPGTVLARITITAEERDRLASHTRSLLAAPILWLDKRRTVRLRWEDLGKFGLSTWVIVGAPHHQEVLDVLAAVGVKPMTTPFYATLRRNPSLGVYADRTGTGEKDVIEQSGDVLVVGPKRGRWKRWFGLKRGEPWPPGAREDLCAHVAPFVGRAFKAPVTHPRFVVERGSPRPNGVSKKGRQLWKYSWDREDAAIHADLSAARAEAGRNADVGATTERWRVRDLGTGAVRSLWWSGAKGLCRRDFDPQRRGKVHVVVVRAAEKKTSKKNTKGK